jgi:predicted NBD/HSP70 family sugar kinase
MTKHPLGNRDLIRAINRSAVLNNIKNHGPISRTETARLTGLSAATISGITAELMEQGLIFEKEEGNSRGGRRPILLAINPRGGFVVGLKLAENQIVGVLTDLEVSIIAKHVQQLDGRDLNTTVTALSQVVGILLRKGDIEPEHLLGVGVGLAGIIDAQKGILRYSPIFGWRDVPIGDLLRNQVQAPVTVGNDVNTLTLTEKWFGKGQGFDNLLTVTIGRGVGLGIIVNGQLYRGYQGGAGEFGHTVIDPDGPECACGNRGCLETFVSDPSLLGFALEAVTRGDLPDSVKTLDDLLRCAQDGNPVARAIYSRAGEVLGRGIANLINIFSPQQIIISGEGVGVGDLIFDSMYASIASHVMPGLIEDTHIEVDVWNDDAWARGAAGLVLQELFESPVNRDEVKTATP